MNEYEVIKRIFRPLALNNSLSFALDDDAGLLPNKKQIVVATDSIVEGYHLKKMKRIPH